MDVKTRKKTQQLLDDCRETRITRKLKEEVLDLTFHTTRFVRGYGPVSREDYLMMTMCLEIVTGSVNKLNT